MDIYHYSQTTGEFLGKGSADPDPLDQGNWLIPAHATTVAPPALKEGFVPVFDGRKWKQVEDHRGKEGYVDGESQTIRDLGPLPKGWGTEPPPPPDPLPDDVRAEAYVRIVAVMPHWMVDRELSGGEAVPEKAKSYAAKVREASRKLRSSDPIPDDFRDDRHWPEKPAE